MKRINPLLTGNNPTPCGYLDFTCCGYRQSGKKKFRNIHSYTTRLVSTPMSSGLEQLFPANPPMHSECSVGPIEAASSAQSRARVGLSELLAVRSRRLEDKYNLQQVGPSNFKADNINHKKVARRDPITNKSPWTKEVIPPWPLLLWYISIAKVCECDGWVCDSEVTGAPCRLVLESQVNI
jgi:hypothetical protein